MHKSLHGLFRTASLRLLLLYCCLLPAAVYAKGTLPRGLVFSYTNHPTTQQYYLPIVRQAYKNLGIELELVEASTARFIQLYQEGKIDGDIARISQLKQFLPDLLLVYKIDDMQVSYHCGANVHCSAADLNNPNRLIFTPVVKKVQQLIKLQLLAKTYEVNSWQQLLDLYQHQKTNRFLMVDGRRFHTTLNATPQRIAIRHTLLPVYHVLHNKYQQLVPLVAAEMKNVMARYPAPTTLKMPD